MSIGKELQALAAWAHAEGGAPDWVLALAREVDAGRSQAALARELGYSAATISQVLAAKYPGNLDKIAARVRTAIMSGRLDCPELGEITGQQCLEQQRKPFSSASGRAVRLWRACQGCERNLQAKEGGA